ncbi:hypothetical protein [Bradyrhizobium sp. WD16]|uniref:hypothetical protein n=1 Tax=Bradyrhizobium sp. WD16 TaxID=1521768 RepID=UPI0020A397E6|nr:hypothetical protein [Bradyrhizobium sp. WD16]
MTSGQMMAPRSGTALFAPLFIATTLVLIGRYRVTAPQGGHRSDDLSARVLRLSTPS